MIRRSGSIVRHPNERVKSHSQRQINPRIELHPPCRKPLRVGLKLITLGKGLIGQHLLEEAETGNGRVKSDDDKQVPHGEAKLGKDVVYP